MTITLDLPPIPAAKAGTGIDRELAPFIARAVRVRPEDVLYYEQQYIDFARVQQALVTTLRSSEVAATEIRLKGVTDFRRIELVIGLSN